MATAARVFVWAARGNRTVDVRRLAGPRQGQFVPPPYLAGHASRPEYDLADLADRNAVYGMLLSHGTAEEITGWVNADLLAASLDHLSLAEHVAGPWRRALRDLGLLPGGEPGDDGPRAPIPARDGTGGAAQAVDTAGEPDRSGDFGDAVEPGEQPGAERVRRELTSQNRDGTGSHRPPVPAALPALRASGFLAKT